MTARDSLEEVSSRYQMLLRIASGGMATVFLGRLKGPEGFYRLVAIKRAHAHLLEDVDTRRMFVQEAKLAARIHHTNVVSVLDIEEMPRELLLVQEYVEGPALSQLLKRCDGGLPPPVAVRIVLDACAGLAAAHALTDDQGQPMGVVHRDVSPHNVLIGRDGVTKLADFGIAKVLHTAEEQTSAGVIKGKLSYMAPEYASGQQLDARSDVFGMGVVLWESLAGRRLFRGSGQEDTLRRIVTDPAPLLSSLSLELQALDEVARCALAKHPEERFQAAAAMGNALRIAAQKAGLLGTHGDVAEFVQSVMGSEFAERRQELNQVMNSLGRGSDDDVTLAVDSSLHGARESAEPTSASALGVERFVSPRPRPRRPVWLALLVVAGALVAVSAGFLLRGRIDASSEHGTNSSAVQTVPSAASRSPQVTSSPALARSVPPVSLAGAAVESGALGSASAPIAAPVSTPSRTTPTRTARPTGSQSPARPPSKPSGRPVSENPY